MVAAPREQETEVDDVEGGRRVRVVNTNAHSSRARLASQRSHST
jgi:hypothetical protein